MSTITRARDTLTNEGKCDLVIKNTKYLNVFTEEIEEGDIGIIGDTIVGVGSYNGEVEIDGRNKIVSPGFVDCHLHIESTMITPEAYGYVALKQGVTTIVADPHEIANVLGIEGIKYMIENSKLTPLSIYFMLPSCVPAVSHEENGCVLSAEDLKELLNYEEVLGLGEVMDVPAVLNLDSQMMDKLDLFRDKIIDGHAPLLGGKKLDQYILSGVKTDHECSTVKEALEKVSKGMYVLIREGSAAKNVEDLYKAVSEKNFRRFAFCSDDKHLEDFIEFGTVSDAVRKIIRKGISPVRAYIMATFNGCCCYGFKDRGAIAPGYKADLIILDDMEEVKINQVLKNGKLIERRLMAHSYNNIVNTVNMEPVNEDVFSVKREGDKLNLIQVKPQSLETELEKVDIKDSGQYVKFGPESDILKIGVFERHKNTGHHSIGFIKGLGIKGGAIAQTIAHDSHNIIVVGDNDIDMAKAVNTLISMHGGIVAVKNGLVISSLPLEIGGLMTDVAPSYVYEKLKNLSSVVKSMGINEGIDPFITLSFMSLPVIPAVKLTTRGLFSYDKFDFIPLQFQTK